MPRTVRTLALCLAVAAALVATGCGADKDDPVILGHTEGIYVTVDDLTYQVQLSRILNPASPEDDAYLRGVPESEQDLAQDEVWFAIFMRVENLTDQPLTSAEEFSIHDTQDAVFEPIEIDPELNVFLYEPAEIPGGGRLLPVPNSPASDNTIQGALILFKVKTESLYNRPLELEIHSPSGGDAAVVDLDV
jgi:hypothetical protein